MAVAPASQNYGGKDQGDVYTRVAIPRSKSFMNVNSQYNLQELFRELKEKEGVESIDDVLKKVITPNGISFNEIKPVYRELLLKLAMTMSQDEIFERSKNIISQEKKTTKKEKKKPNPKPKKKSKSMSGSEQSTLSSFLKMTFSSNKNSSLQSDRQKKASKLNSSLTPSKSSSGYDSALPSHLQTSFLTATTTSYGLPGIKPTTPLFASSNSGGKINKADISGPFPIQNQAPMTNLRSNLPGGHAKFRMPPNTREVLEKLPVPPQQTREVLERLGTPPTPTAHPYSQSKKKQGLLPQPPAPTFPAEEADDAYVSCNSECDYESVCTYDTCSCQGTVRDNTSKRPHLTQPLPPPPMKFQVPGPKAPVTAVGGAHVNKISVSPDDPEDIYCDCDAESCVSSEKCYCSLRGHPQEKKRTMGSRPHLHPTPEEADEEEEEVAIVTHQRLPNNTTIIHCNGSGGTSRTGTLRSVASGVTTASSSTCSSCSCDTIGGLDSGSTATDTTCHSIKHQHMSLNGCESPGTAWRRNQRQINGHSASPHSGTSCCEYDDSPLHRKNSAGSGYHSSESVLHQGHGRRSGPSSSGSSSGSSCYSGSSCASRIHQKRAQLQQKTQPLAAKHGGRLFEQSQHGLSRSQSRLLMVSAVDRGGKVGVIDCIC